MSLLQTILAFLFAILLLVSVHELGHLLVARWCGIKVLRFSVGFGSPFYTKKWRNIEWCLAPIPLGGYVKMADTRESEVAPEDLPYAFDKQHPLKRIAVVVAGPLTNLILAVVLYALAFDMGGVTEIRPYVGTVHSPSIAASAGFQAGDQIVSLGISAYQLINQIGMVQPHSAAAKAGLKVGDQIIAVNGIATPKWEDWSKVVRENAGRNLKIAYVRQNHTFQTTLLPESVELPNRGQIIGRAGVAAAIDKAWEDKVRHHYDVGMVESLKLGCERTVKYSTMTLQFFGKLVLGQASLSHISGPLTIADVAGQTVQIGWQPYVEFLALVSISLGVMNLLPIPVLDGGHLVYYTVEFLCGRPLSKRIQELGLRFGLAIMLMMMMLAFFNDITRLFG